MASEMVSVRGGTVTDTTLILPDNLSEKRWTEIGEQLGGMERAVGWWIGDWWNAGEKYKGRVKLVKDNPNWKGPAYQTCRSYGSVAAKFDLLKRSNSLPFSHYHALASLEPERATVFLEHAAEVAKQSGEPPPVRMMKQYVKAERRGKMLEAMARPIEQAAKDLASTPRRYAVIYADPPWRFEPYSRETGMDRAADNHYPTMTLEQLSSIAVPAAPDSALFLWATTPMLLDALELMANWDFDYRTHWIWVKPSPGTGYWNRSCHELLLLGTRGRVPAPAPGTQMDSVFEGAVAGHSVKPAAAAEMIEEMFPNAACLEMFARGPRLGWTTWGAEAQSESQERTEHDSGVERLFRDEADAAARAVIDTDGRAA